MLLFGGCFFLFGVRALMHAIPVVREGEHTGNLSWVVSGRSAAPLSVFSVVEQQLLSAREFL